MEPHFLNGRFSRTNSVHSSVFTEHGSDRNAASFPRWSYHHGSHCLVCLPVCARESYQTHEFDTVNNNLLRQVFLRFLFTKCITQGFHSRYAKQGSSSFHHKIRDSLHAIDSDSKGQSGESPIAKGNYNMKDLDRGLQKSSLYLFFFCLKIANNEYANNNG